MRKKIARAWQALAIRNKIALFISGTLLIILLSCILDVLVIRFSMVDFSRILQVNSRNSNLVQNLEREIESFASFVRNPDTEKKAEMEDAIAQTRASVQNLPMDYLAAGPELYAKTWAIKNSHGVYETRRDGILRMGEEDPAYISSLYEVYDMQKYLLEYANDLMIGSMEAGNRTYHAKYFWMIGIPLVAIALILLDFLMVLELAGMMNHAITHPVLELADASRKIAANDFYIEDVKVDNQDELGELVAAFNKMKEAMGRYVQAQEENREAQEKLHEKEVERLEMERRLESAKVKIMMNQIDPHFLFNTLNVISGMADLEEADITEKMIRALSDLFRYNLKNDQPAVPLERELKVVEDYMYLQHMRFGARISYKVDCRVDAKAVLVPSFLFQPLVENSIIHGLSPKVEGGRILIRAWQRGNRLTITVADNGVGMDSAVRERLLAQLSEDGGEEGIGFSNVAKRVLAMYPDGAVDLFSRPGRGTVIRICMIRREA